MTLPLTVDSPAYLGLLILVPLVWYFSFRSLAGLGHIRRLLALLLRTAVLILLVLSAAESQWVRTSDRVTVIYLLDQSWSIPAPRRASMIEYVNQAIRRHRKADDRAGVIVFGREPQIEIPPLDEDFQIPPAVESQLDPEYTNLAGAIKLAEASFPEDSSKRIVIVSDGNENIGSALAQAELSREAGIGIDVWPVVYSARGDVAVEKLTLPPDVRKGQPFDMRVVVNNMTPPERGGSGALSGRLIVSERTDDQPLVISDQHVELPPGKHVFTLRQQIERPNFYSYEARFVPDRADDDSLTQNNRATAFTHVRGSGQVLLIEDAEHRGEHQQIVDQLGKDNLEVTVQPSDRLFASLAELQPFDAVILANVPRAPFSEQQISMLVRNTQDLGCGLVMLGGPESFGAGGWTNTEIEKVMPVDFQIKNIKVVPSGALVLVLDSSGSMTGEKLHMSKAAAIAAVKALGEKDYVGVVAFDSAARWIVPMQQIKNPGGIVAAIEMLGAAGGTNMYPGMEQGYRAIRPVPAALKHMIVLTDGQTEGARYEQMAAEMRRQGITTTCVAVGQGAAAQLLENIAQAGGGKFYLVHDPRAIPRIFMKEAMRVARPLVFEDQTGFRPKIEFPHEITSGVGSELPPLTGYVMTTVKNNPLVEVSIVSPVPKADGHNVILATWTYGLGKTVAFTSDAGARWAGGWTAWSGYGKLFSQMVRWSMRPVADEGRFTIATDATPDGRVSVVVTALTKNQEFLNFLDLGGTVIDPHLGRSPIKLEQTAPGRYIGRFDAKDSGSYLLAIGSGGQAPLLTGINVPYSAEFRDTGANVPLLEDLAAHAPKHGLPGQVIAEPTSDNRTGDTATVNSFRHDLPKASSTQDQWANLLWLAGCLFVADVCTRRVSISLAWLRPLASRVVGRLLWRKKASAPVAHLERLRSRKAEVSQSLQQRHGAARFELSSGAAQRAAASGQEVNLESLSAAASAPSVEPSSSSKSLAPQPPSEQGTYTDRLLKAKQAVWHSRDKKPK